jgi:hypothetical protein
VLLLLIVLDVVPVLSVVIELVTLDWLSRMTEPAPPDEAVLPFPDVIEAPPGPAETVLPSRPTIVAEPPPAVTLAASTLVQIPSAANVTRYFFISLSKALASGVDKHSPGQRRINPE